MLRNKLMMIGCGNIGGAIINGLVRSQAYRAEDIICCDPNLAKLEAYAQKGLQVSVSAARKISEINTLILAVKPGMVKSVLGEIADDLKRLGRELTIISVAAGVRIATIADLVGGEVKIVRVMPNLPCVIGHGVTAVCGKDSQALETASKIFSTVGSSVVVNTEEELDAVTGLSGSGPGFVFEIIDAFIKGGIRVGLSPDVSSKLAVEMLAGAGAMIKESGELPCVLRDRVATPGGTTQAGLNAMIKLGVEEAVCAAVEAATKRSKEISQGLA